MQYFDFNTFRPSKCATKYHYDFVRLPQNKKIGKHNHMGSLLRFSNSPKLHNKTCPYFSSWTLIIGPSHIQPSQNVFVSCIYMYRVEKKPLLVRQQRLNTFLSLTLFGLRSLLFQPFLNKQWPNARWWCIQPFFLHPLGHADFRHSFHTQKQSWVILRILVLQCHKKCSTLFTV